MRNHDQEARIERLAEKIASRNGLGKRVFAFDDDRREHLFALSQEAKREHDLSDESAEYLREQLDELTALPQSA